MMHTTFWQNELVVVAFIEFALRAFKSNKSRSHAPIP